MHPRPISTMARSAAVLGAVGAGLLAGGVAGASGPAATPASSTTPSSTSTTLTHPVAPTVGLAPDASKAAHASALLPGATLGVGQELTTSPGAPYLVMQTDGNLVEYSGSGRVLWQARTNGSPGATATMLASGNLVISSTAHRLLWTTWIGNDPGSTLSITSSGALLVTATNGLMVWRNGVTNGCSLSNLCAGASLLAGHALTSPDGRSQLFVSPTGLLTITGPGGTLWQSPRRPVGGTTLTLQSDGNLVMTGASGVPVFATGTGGQPVISAQLTNGGTLVLTDSIHWQYWTVGGPLGISGSRLRPAQVLGLGASISSPDGIFRLGLGTDGNLVLRQGGTPIWQTGTANRLVFSAVMGTDGNLVLYNLAGAPVWWTGTWGHGASSLYVTDAGMLQIRRPEGSLIWNGGSSLAARIVSLALSQDQFTAGVQAVPLSSNCNPYSGLLGRGSTWGCQVGRGPGGAVQYSAEEWCSDFAQWVWQSSGANVSSVSAWSFNFVVNGQNLGTFQPGPTNNPEPGDAVVWGDIRASYGQHVGIVSAVSGNQISMISGNWGDEVGDSGFFNPATSTVAGYPIIGFIRPIAAGGRQGIHGHVRAAVVPLAAINRQGSGH